MLRLGAHILFYIAMILQVLTLMVRLPVLYLRSFLTPYLANSHNNELPVPLRHLDRPGDKDPLQ